MPAELQLLDVQASILLLQIVMERFMPSERMPMVRCSE